jgi:DNA-binding NtrC family response regulator
MEEKTSNTKIGTNIDPTSNISEINSRLMLVVRVCLLSIALLTASFWSFANNWGGIPDKLIFAPIGILFAFTGISAFWMRKNKPNQKFIYLQLIADILLVTGAIYLTGGASSPVLFLYLPMVMATALIVSRAAALGITVFSTTLYSALTFAIHNHIIPTADGGPIPTISLNNIFLQIFGLTSGMILVAILTDTLTRLMKASQSEVQQSRRDIAELNSSQKALTQQLEIQDRMARLLAERNNPETSITAIEHFIGESLVMQKVFSLIQRVSTSDATVLISGESGTGKELVAKAIHKGKYPHPSSPFVAVNCGAIPENLIESQLFGHKRGSFTGAEADSPGLFLQAHGGTIFLDEIGELPLLMQSKLLRAIQEKSVRPIGGSKDVPIDVRIIAATNRNLKNEIETGKFREDLFYRLNVINIKLPPLRARKEDIPLLVNHIVKRLLPEGKEAVIPPATLQILSTYNYPGNVRELENILERAIVLGGEVILPEHLPSSIKTPSNQGAPSIKPDTAIIIDENLVLPVNLDSILSNIERKYLEVALLKTDGLKKKAADLLGMNFRSFRYRLQKYGISDE